MSLSDAPRTTAPRDPEGRRAAILEAAASIALESGLGALTHRVIAKRAGVPLGSTTYYFPTLDDLVLKALTTISDSHAAGLQEWKNRLAEHPGPDAIVAMMEDYLSNRPVATLEYEVYGAAARRPELRGLALSWANVLESALRTVATPERARGVAFAIDGAVVNALLAGTDLDSEALRRAIAAQLDAA